MCVVSSCVVGWIVVVMVTRVMGRADCLSLLLMKSLSKESNFELSSAMPSQVMSLVRSLLSVGSVWCKIRCWSRLPVSWPVFPVSSTLIAWLILLGSSWRPTWSNGLGGVW